MIAEDKRHRPSEAWAATPVDSWIAVIRLSANKRGSVGKRQFRTTRDFQGAV